MGVGGRQEGNPGKKGLQEKGELEGVVVAKATALLGPVEAAGEGREGCPS